MLQATRRADGWSPRLSRVPEPLRIISAADSRAIVSRWVARREQSVEASEPQLAFSVGCVRETAPPVR